MAAHFSQQQRFHFLELFSVSRILREVELVFGRGGTRQRGDLTVVVLKDKLVGIVREIEELRFMHGATCAIVFNQLPIAFLDAPHAGLGAATVNAIQDVADRLALAFQNGPEANALVGLRRGDAGDVAERRQTVEQVNVAFYPRAWLDARTFDDERHAPAMLIE